MQNTFQLSKMIEKNPTFLAIRDMHGCRYFLKNGFSSTHVWGMLVTIVGNPIVAICHF